MNRSLFFLLFLFSTVTTSWSVEEGEDHLEVYLLIGQSNMAGRAALGAGDENPIPGAQLWSAEGAWEAATNPLNRHSTIRKEMKMQRMGPGYGFAQAMAVLQPEEQIGLVVNAKGGSKIEEWLPGSTFFEQAMQRLKAALSTPNAELAGILWHQGEGNAGDEDYLKKLEALVSALREELGDLELPFVAGQIYASVDAPTKVGFNERILAMPERIPHTALVSTETLTATDSAHFDTPSMRLLGLRYAEAMVTLQRKLEKKE